MFCRNDDAFLCTECDAQAHANPLAARHIRVPASEAHSGTTAAPAPEHNQPADCVSESAGAVPVTPNALAAGGIVPPAVELPTNQVMDKDALAKAFGKDLEVRQDRTAAHADAGDCCQLPLWLSQTLCADAPALVSVERLLALLLPTNAHCPAHPAPTDPALIPLVLCPCCPTGFCA